MHSPTPARSQLRRASPLLFAAAMLLATAACAQVPPPPSVATGGISQPIIPDASPLPDETPRIESGDLALHFKEGRSVLTAEARHALDRAVPRLLDHLAAGGRVLILGQFDQAGRPDETPMLAVRRAEVVAFYLHDAWGIDPRRLELRPSGHLHPAEGAHSMTGSTRRVAIVLQPRRVGAEHPLVQGDRLDLDDFGGADNPLAQAYPRSLSVAGRN